MPNNASHSDAIRQWYAVSVRSGLRVTQLFTLFLDPNKKGYSRKGFALFMAGRHQEAVEAFKEGG